MDEHEEQTILESWANRNRRNIAKERCPVCQGRNRMWAISKKGGLWVQCTGGRCHTMFGPSLPEYFVRGLQMRTIRPDPLKSDEIGQIIRAITWEIT